MGPWEGFGWGLLGGFIAELLGWFKLRHQDDLPQWSRNWLYWIPTLVMILMGGALVVAYQRSDFKINAIMAINVGASAPLILGSLISQTPHISPGKID
jgi:peptidoglycan/LPS O-acetylase OafA/YrhL